MNNYTVAGNVITSGVNDTNINANANFTISSGGNLSNPATTSNTIGGVTLCNGTANVTSGYYVNGYPAPYQTAQTFMVAAGYGGGAAGNMLWSTDGKTWNASTNNTYSTAGNSVAWNGSVWVAAGYGVGAAGSMMWSTDGKTWNASANNTFSTQGRSVAWNGSVWVAAGQGASAAESMMWSTDGKTWNASTNNTFSGAGNSVAWNGSLWVAGGEGGGVSGNMMWSTDGKTWNASTNNTFFTAGYSVAWNGSVWVAAGQTSSGAAGSMMWSTDGKTWNASANNTFSVTGRGVAWNGGVWVAAGDGGGAAGSLMWSPDGKTWNASTNNTFSVYGRSVAWNGSVWVAAGSGGGAAGSMMWSTDGKTWSASTNSTFPFLGLGVASAIPLTTYVIPSQINGVTLSNSSIGATTGNSLFIRPPSGQYVSLQNAGLSSYISLYSTANTELNSSTGYWWFTNSVGEVLRIANTGALSNSNATSNTIGGVTLNNGLFSSGNLGSHQFGTVIISNGVVSGLSTSNLTLRGGTGGATMTLCNSGNIGIANTSPAKTLDVTGVARVNSNWSASSATPVELFAMCNTAAVDAVIRIAFGSYNGATAAIDATVNGLNNFQSALSFKTYTGAAFLEGLNISSSQIIKISSYTTNGAVSTISGTGTLSVSSDRRIKTNIQYMGDEDATSKILALKPARFELMADPSNTQLGFIAQDVETVIPEAVDGKKYEYEWKRDENGNPVVDSNGQLIITDTPRYRGFSDRPVLATLVKAFQELSARLSNVEARLAAATTP